MNPERAGRESDVQQTPQAVGRRGKMSNTDTVWGVNSLYLSLLRASDNRNRAGPNIRSHTSLRWLQLDHRGLSENERETLHLFGRFLQLHHTSVDIQYNSTPSAVTSLCPWVCQMKEASLTPPANTPELRPREKEPRETQVSPTSRKTRCTRGVHEV